MAPRLPFSLSALRRPTPVATSPASASSRSKAVPGTAQARVASPKPVIDRPKSASGGVLSQEFGGTYAAGAAGVPAISERRPPPAERRRAANRIDYEHASDGDVEDILAYRGEVLTSPGGAIDVTAAQRRMCAFLANGWMVIDKEAAVDASVLSVIEDINRSQRTISRAILVELSVVRKVNERAEKQLGGRSAVRIDGVETQEFQTEFLNLVEAAAKRRVSDIHLLVGSHETVIEFRSNSVILRETEKPRAWGDRLMRAAFAMTEASDPNYLPLEYQGARISNIKIALPAGVQSIRLQFNPQVNSGRYLVCRLLYEGSDNKAATVATLGYARCHVRDIARMMRRSEGINIISGPTGSGKSTTLVRVLETKMATDRGIRVLTIEDPPEYVINGAIQLPVVPGKEEERNRRYGEAISAALRDDPDVIMIGEIREKFSANLAFTAASTGHQVYCSLHANSAYKILGRLQDIEVERYKLADPDYVTGLIGQRLMRKLCPHCKRRFVDLKASELSEMREDLIEDLRRVCGDRLDEVYVSSGTSCGHCMHGIAGREVIAETIHPDEEFMRMVREENHKGAIEHWLSDMGGLAMHEHATQKMLRGLADPRDVERAVGGALSMFDMNRRDVIFGALND